LVRLVRHVGDALQDGLDRVALDEFRSFVPHQVLDDDLSHVWGRLRALERRAGEFSDAVQRR
jgi:hypothetical protein